MPGTLAEGWCGLDGYLFEAETIWYTSVGVTNLVARCPVCDREVPVHRYLRPKVRIGSCRPEGRSAEQLLRHAVREVE